MRFLFDPAFWVRSLWLPTFVFLVHCTAGRFHDREHNQKLLERLDEFISQLEEQIAGAAPEPARVEMTKSLGRGELLREKVRGALSQIEREESRHAHPQETQARRMRTPGRNRFSYNAQVVVDAAQSVITAQEVVSDANDEHQLVPMMEAAKENLGLEAAQTLADCGYSSASQLAAAAERSSSGLYVPLPRHVQNSAKNPYHCSQFKWDSSRDVVICPQGASLKFHHQRSRSGQAVRLYRDCSVCARCPVRGQCTTDRHGRSIEITPSWQRLQEHRRRMEQEDSQALMRKRGAVIERVFAQIKGHWNFHRWQFKGLTNVRAQWDLLCTT